MIKKIFHHLFPNQCIFCLENLFSDRLICENCERTLIVNNNLVDSGFENFIAPFAYESPIRELILGLKFNGKLKYAKLFGELLSAAIIKSKNPLPSAIIPVPLHPKRLKTRGFNQALEIAKIMSKRLKIPIDQTSIIRIKNTKAQSELKSEGRHKNMESAFVLKKKMPYAHIALLDDVYTTGATLQSLAKVITENQPMKISIWCCARALMK